MKTKLIATLTLLVVSAALISCNGTTVSKPDNVDTKVTDNSTTVIPQDEASCKQRGGTWNKVGLAGFFACTIQMPDAGKSCTDSSQCERHCMTNIGESGNQVTGQCQSTNHAFGCWSEVIKGVAQPGLCVD